MKLAIAVILALVCSMAIADPPVKACQTAKQFLNATGCYDCSAGSPFCTECVVKNGKVSCINCGVGTGKFLEIKDNVGVCTNCTGNCSTCRGPAHSDCVSPSATDFKISPSAIVKCTGLDGCMWCKEENKCGKCQVGYRLAEDKCTPCAGTNCVDCSDAISDCKKCAFNNELKDKACQPCTGCSSCPCKGCLPGYNFNNNTCTLCTVGGCSACAANKTQCTACFDGFFLGNNTCEPCGANCKKCTAADKCTECSSKFGLKDGKCSACPDNCKECNGDLQCTKCKDNFYITTDKKCTVCPEGCDGPCTDGKCAKCLPGYVAKAENKGCEACTTSKIGCKECANSTACKTCDDDYVLDDKAQCNDARTCPLGKARDDKNACVDGYIENCISGNNKTGTCARCGEGYYPKDKTCAPCPNGCKNCMDLKGNVLCLVLGQEGFSNKISTNFKSETGYLGKNLVYTVDRNGSDDQCMPNTWRATYTKESTKHKCLDYDKCPILQKAQNWECQIEGNAVKMTLSLFAIVVATLFTL